MSEGFDKLKDIGVQKIHEATHISRVHVQAFLHECFDDMTKIQFLGFVSILEREYGVNLSDLKAKALEDFDAVTEKAKEEDGAKVFVSKKKRNLTIIYIATAIIIFIAFAMSTIINPDSPTSDINGVDDSVIESAKNNMMIVARENNESIEENNESIEQVKDVNLDKPSGFQQAPEVKKESGKNLSFKIIPKHELWLGYIDLSTFERDQKLFSDELSLDPDKDWLLTLGHGYISIEINGVIKEFTNPKTVRFSYINKELKELTFKEFKSLNRDNEW